MGVFKPVVFLCTERLHVIALRRRPWQVVLFWTVDGGKATPEVRATDSKGNKKDACKMLQVNRST